MPEAFASGILLFALLFFLFDKQRAERHHDRKHDQIPDILHSVPDDAGIDHEQSADDRKDRQHKAPHHGFILLLLDPADEDRL